MQNVQCKKRKYKKEKLTLILRKTKMLWNFLMALRISISWMHWLTKYAEKQREKDTASRTASCNSLWCWMQTRYHEDLLRDQLHAATNTNQVSTTTSATCNSAHHLRFSSVHTIWRLTDWDLTAILAKSGYIRPLNNYGFVKRLVSVKQLTPYTEKCQHKSTNCLTRIFLKTFTIMRICDFFAKLLTPK